MTDIDRDLLKWLLCSWAHLLFLLTVTSHIRNRHLPSII